MALHASHLTGKLKKTAIGATDSVQWKYFQDTLLAIKDLRGLGYRVVPVEQTDTSIMLDEFLIQKNEKLAFIFGNEVKGVSNEVIELFDESIEIPQFGTKHSLNISVSVGVVLWEVIKRLM